MKIFLKKKENLIIYKSMNIYFIYLIFFFFFQFLKMVYWKKPDEKLNKDRISQGYYKANTYIN
jgi:hypothetical protein